MKHFLISIEEINSPDTKKTYVINQYEKDKIDSIINESQTDIDRKE